MNFKLSHLIRLFLLVFMVLLFAGCATTIPLSLQDRQRIHTVSVSPYVDMPNGMSYESLATDVENALFRPLGSAYPYTYSRNDSDARKIVFLSKRQNADLDKLLVQNVKEQLIKKGFRVTDKGNAEMDLIVNAYGLAPSAPFSPKLKPIINATAKLVMSGRVVWQQNANLTSMKTNIARHTKTELIQNPILLKAIWSQLAKEAAIKLVNQLVVTGHSP